MNGRAATIIAGLVFAADAAAMIFPHLDYSAHLERGRPGEESFGTLVDDPPTQVIPSPPLPIDYERTITPAMAAAIAAYEAHLENRDFEQAVDSARLLLDVIAEELGSDHVEYAYALSDLGAALHHAGRNEEALAPLQESISLIGAANGLYSPVLIGPMAYLGMAFQGLERHEPALDALTRAQHITHRHWGAMNPYQLKLVYAKAASLESLNELHEAEDQLRLGLKLSREQHGEEALESLPALYYLAEWLRATGAFRPALSLYRDAMLMLAGPDGEDTPAMVPAMRGMAATFLLEQDVEVDRGLTLHRRIVELMEARPEAFSATDRIQAYADLGDWLILFEREEEAWDAYGKAWALGQSDPTRDWNEYFAEPRLIYAGPNLTVDFMGYQVIGEEVYYDFEFRIREDGRPSHVKVRDSNLSTLTRSRAIGFLRLGKFRPAIVDGKPVERRDYRIRRYYPTVAPWDYGKVILGGGFGSTPRTRLERRWPGSR
ncbi:MAG: tetratricopeptide repeat protein [Xanthomonadales bacterium]|nr:tetratricopeptide repeat protein [Xanthomonadales bacterium]